MILTADHVRDAAGDVVDHRREAVEIGTVGAHKHRIALARLVDMLRPAHQIVPAHVPGRQLESPVRIPPLAFQPRPIGLGELSAARS